MSAKTTNNAYGTLAGDINNSATTINLSSGQGAKFPSLSAGEYFYGTLIAVNNTIEIVKVTARSSDALTVTRAQDNTSASAFSTGDRFELRPTAALFNEFVQKTGDNTMVGTLTVGADDTGHDVKFFGATSGKYMEWDESADQLDVTGSFDVTGDSSFNGDVDVDGTLEADAMTLNGTAITTTATLSTGISNGNLPVFTSGVADDDFLRVSGTSIEGRSASEVLSDIGGQASLTFGISNTNAVKVDSASVADDEYARFTANGLESRSTAEVLSDIGGQASLTFGISNTNAVKIDSASVADDEYARFTANGLESRSTSEVLSDIGATTATAAADEATALAIALGG